MKRAIGLAVLLSACVHAPPRAGPQDPFAALEQMEQARTLRASGLELAVLARDADPAVRARALEVVARLQRPELVGVVLADLAEGPALAAAAFAAGQYGLSWRPLPKAQLAGLAAATQAALTRASANPDRPALLRALGKLGQADSTAVLASALDDPDASVRGEAALALGALAYSTKGAAPDVTVVNPLAHLLAHDADPQVRFDAAYALMRMKRPETRAALTYGIKDGDARVRAVCARGLAEVATAPELPYLLERLGDPDSSVRVEAARSLGKLAGKSKPLAGATAAAGKALAVLAKAYDPARPATAMPLLALVQEKFPASDSELADIVAGLAPAKRDADAHGRAVVACHLAASRDRLRADASTPALDGCAPTADLLDWREALAVRTIAGSAADAKPRAAALLGRPVSSTVAAEAVDDALGELSVDTPEVRARILRDLSSTDWGVALSAAAVAGKLGITEAVPALHRALTLASVHDQHDVLGALLVALAKLHAKDAGVLARRYAHSPHATVRFGALDALEALHAEVPAGEPLPLEFHGPLLERGEVANISTERGEIRIRLRPGSFTAENFVKLARAGFYDQLTFHRIVPGFVAQGGDPRGDGSGGPGYSIPCEIDGERYARGAVGMALAGKDTGGSQFFITLSPQPHLEGRYTLFGNVISGMEVADQLMEGDRILRVEVEP